MANGFTNFMNGLSNEAQRRLSDPLIDLWALAAKWVNKGLDWITWDDLSKTTNAKIDKASKEIKAQMKSEVDPTSMAWAIWEGLYAWLDNANIVMWLANMAREIWRYWLKKLPQLLNKYKDAKDKKAQLKAAQEIREYVNWQYNSMKPLDMWSDIPAYQQKRYAQAINRERAADGTMQELWEMETFIWQSADNPWEMRTMRNMTEKFRDIDKDPTIPRSQKENVKSMAYDADMDPESFNYWENIRDWEPNGLKAPLSRSDARELDIPYGWSNMKEVRAVSNAINDIANMSNKEFREFMSSNEYAAMAWYEPSWWDYRVEDLWHSGDLWKTKKAVIDWILNNHTLEQEWTLTASWENAIRNNILKNSKRYRNWVKKEMKNNYDYDTKWMTRKDAFQRTKAEENWVRQEALARKRETMKDFWITSKQYDEAEKAAKNTWVYYDNRGYPVNRLEWVWWPEWWLYFVENPDSAYMAKQWYTVKHPSTDEYLALLDEERTVSELARLENQSIMDDLWAEQNAF